MADIISTTVAAVLMLMTFSFAVRYNRLYRVAENIFIGTVAANTLVIAFDNLTRVTWQPFVQKGDLFALSVLIFGLLVFTRMYKQYDWISRYPIAFMVGTSIGIAMSKTGEAYILGPVRAMIGPLTPSLFIQILFTVLCILFFTFTVIPGKSISRGMSTVRMVALWLIVTMVGVDFANITAARISMLIARIMFLYDWVLALFRG